MYSTPRQVLTGPKPTRLMCALRTATTLSKECETSLRVALVRAKEAVRLASRLCHNVQRKIDISQKTQKQDHSPVTIADFGAQAIVTWSLLQHYPKEKLNLIAEEDSSLLRSPQGADILAMVTAQVNEILPVQLTSEEILDLIDLGGSMGGPRGDHWVLDPVDGTRGFVQMRQYAVCLGLIQDGEAVLGTMACPNLPRGPVDVADGSPGRFATAPRSLDIGALFSACRGGGAHEEPLWGSAPLTAAGTSSSLSSSPPSLSLSSPLLSGNSNDNNNGHSGDEKENNSNSGGICPPNRLLDEQEEAFPIIGMRGEDEIHHDNRNNCNSSSSSSSSNIGGNINLAAACNHSGDERRLDNTVQAVDSSDAGETRNPEVKANNSFPHHLPAPFLSSSSPSSSSSSTVTPKKKIKPLPFPPLEEKIQDVPSASFSSSSSPLARRVVVLDTSDMTSVRVMESFEAGHSRHDVSASIRSSVGLDPRPLRMDSQVKYGILARGAAPVCAFMRFPPPLYKEKIWDHCAGAVIVQEAGGKVSDGTGAPLDFSKGRHVPLRRGLVAAAPRVHAALVAAIGQDDVASALDNNKNLSAAHKAKGDAGADKP